MKKFAILISIVLLFALAHSCDFKKSGPSGPNAPGVGTRVGDIAADFTLLDQNGQPVSLSDYRGQVILLDLSTMWCTYCQIEASTAEQLYQQYRSQGFVMMNALFANYKGGPITVENCEEWAEFYKISFPILADVSQAVYDTYNELNAIPLNIVIDRDFIIRYKATGYNETAIRATIENYL
jgi:peroxiredoxin